MRVKELKTIFIDIDGVLLQHWGETDTQATLKSTIILPGAVHKINQWILKGYVIVLVTGRRESERRFTIDQLEYAGIRYDQLIMGVGRGDRVIINDIKPDSDDAPTAVAINVERNKGISNIEIW